MTELLMLPFIGEERSKILIKRGYTIEKIRNSTPDEISEILGVPKYISYHIIKAAHNTNINKVPNEFIAEETLCPQCGAVVTELEYECGSCGYILKDINPIEYQKHIGRYVELFIKISHEPENIELWKEAKKTLEALGNIEEALDISNRIEYMKSEIAISKVNSIKREIPIDDIPKNSKSKNGLANGFGVQAVPVEKVTKTKKYLSILIAIGIIAGMLMGVYLMNPPFKIDGKFGDWSTIPGYHTFDSSIKVFKMGEYGSNYYFYIGGTLKLNLGVTMFIDSDGDPRTGYALGAIGADYRLVIRTVSNKISGSIYSFASTNPLNWSAWENAGTFKVAGGTEGVEMELQNDIFTQNASIVLVNGEHRGYPIGLFHPLLLSQMVLGGGTVTQGSELGTLYLNNTFKRAIQIKSLTLRNLGNATSLNLTAYINGRNMTVIDNKLSFSTPLIIAKSLSINITYQSGGAVGSTIRLGVKSIHGLKTALYVRGDGYYVKNAPSTPKIDGIFYDWAYYRKSAPKTNVPANVDIVSYGKYANFNFSYFYIQTRGEIAAGTIIPPYRNTTKDSDRDTIPDNIDPYPHDFNNDGIPDDKSVVDINGTLLPDVDRDGIPDYPYGSDMWLNTTIPNTTTFPPQYRGKFVSAYIGSSKGTKPIYPYDYIEIYISGNSGYPINGINAKYLFKLYGLSGHIYGYNFMEYKNGKFVNKPLHLNLTRDIAVGWSRIEMKLPINITHRNIVYRIVSYAHLWEDTAPMPFQKSEKLHLLKLPKNENCTKNNIQCTVLEKGYHIGGFSGSEFKQNFENLIQLNMLTLSTSSLIFQINLKSFIDSHRRIS